MMQSETVVNPATAVERLWHYVQDGRSEGPVSESEMQQMLVEGRLGADSLVWTESMAEWMPAGRIEAFHDRLAVLPLVVARPATTLRQRAQSARAQGVPQVRPWVRYLARSSDLWISGFVTGLIAGYAGVMTEIPRVVLGLTIPFAWLFVEALLLSTWGTTPGKWLFSTWVADATGNRLSYANALSRAFSVWFVGMGLCLPIVTVITLVVSYVKLKNQGITPWDREGRCAVIHEPLRPVRITVAIVALLAVLCLSVASHVLLAVQQTRGV
jgi:uncharacterized RDD family membrane protein YckC